MKKKAIGNDGENRFTSGFAKKQLELYLEETLLGTHEHIKREMYIFLFEKAQEHNRAFLSFVSGLPKEQQSLFKYSGC